MSPAIMRKAHGDKGGLQSGRDALRIKPATSDREKAKSFAQAFVELYHRPILGLASSHVAGCNHGAS